MEYSHRPGRFRPLVKGIFDYTEVKARFVPVHLPLHFQMKPVEIFYHGQKQAKKNLGFFNHGNNVGAGLQKKMHLLLLSCPLNQVSKGVTQQVVKTRIYYSCLARGNLVGSKNMHLLLLSGQVLARARYQGFLKKKVIA